MRQSEILKLAAKRLGKTRRVSDEEISEHAKIVKEKQRRLLRKNKGK